MSDDSRGSPAARDGSTGSTRPRTPPRSTSANTAGATSGSRTPKSHCLGVFEVDELHRSTTDADQWAHWGFDDASSEDIDDAEDQL